MDLPRVRAYYDEFAAGYEAKRRPNDPSGYHALIDDLEVNIVERYGRGKDILECGCGTGLLLERFAKFGKSAKGIDLSDGMLALAKERGLDVTQGSVTDLPFADESFDVTCSFKVLAHVEDIGKALAEMTRVTRRGGIVLAEFYNPWSFRGALKAFGPAGKISAATKESAVFTRFDAPWQIPLSLPPSVDWEDSYGVRIVTPFAGAVRVPVLGKLLASAEHALSATKAAYFAGFFVAALRRREG